jgi:hypothetical protein
MGQDFIKNEFLADENKDTQVKWSLNTPNSADF